MPFLSLTTWSLHRNLGPLRWTKWDDQKKKYYDDVQEQPELISLLELPAKLAEKGFAALDVCNFHIPDTSESYLAALRNSFRRAGVRFYTLLLEYGDISSADPIRRTADIVWIQRWIDFAASAGAERVRIIAGDADPSDHAALQRSAEALKLLCSYASLRGIRVITENFRSLSSKGDNCLSLLKACGPALGFISDFGNFKGAGKYEELASTIPLSESIHAKPQIDADGGLDEPEFARCLEIVKQAGYEGPLTVVYDGPNDMWEGIERVRALIKPYLTA